MRWPVLAAAVLLAGPALAEELPAPPQTVALTLEVEQVHLIVSTLGAISCQNVTQLVVCQQAADLLRELRRQVKSQVK